MQVTPSAERPFPTPPTPNAPDLESAKLANRDTVVLPDEMVIRILKYLGTTDIAICRRVSRYWQTLIDTRHLLARSFYRDCHLTQRITSLAAQRNLAVELYHSHTRSWLTDFSDRGRATAEQLDNILEDVHFPKVLFFSIPKLLLNSNELTYQNIATIEHSSAVSDARFSPDGKYLMTASYDKTVKLLELEGGQWREKATLMHSAWVRSASFSTDGKRLVTASNDGITKLWRLEDDRWQEKATIVHPEMMINAQFSPDGKHLVSNSMDGTVKICELSNGQWEVKRTIQYPLCFESACFSPDGKHLVIPTVTISDLTDSAELWELVDGKWQKNTNILHSGIVTDVHFSPDGKHFVTASGDGAVKICGLFGGKWQEKATIWHSDMVTNASFSRDGKLLVSACCDGTAKICGLVGGKWQEIVTIGHSKMVTNASFGPDYQLVTASKDNTVNVWVLKNKENNDNS